MENVTENLEKSMGEGVRLGRVHHMCSYTSKEQQVYSKESARSGFWRRAAGEGKRVPARSREERHQRQVLQCDEHLM